MDDPFQSHIGGTSLSLGITHNESDAGGSQDDDGETDWEEIIVPAAASVPAPATENAVAVTEAEYEEANAVD